MEKKIKRNNIDRAGIGALTLLFSNTEWAFREEPITDIGIDAQLEIIENNISTGQLIALQVKSGLSFFTNEQDDSYIFYVDSNHIEYWFKHNLPVVLILYHPLKKKLYWSPISMETVIATNKGYKVIIYKDMVLTEITYLQLKKTFFLHDRILYRFNKLEIQLPWIQRIAKGIEVTVEFSDYINKSLSRTEATISCYENDKEIIENISTTYCPGLSTIEIIQSLFPWAELKMNEDKYREAQEEYYTYNEGIYDKESDQYFYHETFDEFYEAPEGIVAISKDYEINTYNVILELNEIGKSFLEIYNFLNNPSYTEIRTFTIDDVLSDNPEES